MPATATILRPTFTDISELDSATFNNCTAVSITVPDATPANFGVVRLTGDLAGTAAAPQLALTGVTAGTYGAALKVPVFTVDAKGRITSIVEAAIPQPDASPAAKGAIQLAGDLAGTASLPTLVATTVSAGTYGTADQALEIVADPSALAALVVVAGDIGKRFVRVTSTGLHYVAAAVGSGADKWTAVAAVANRVFTMPTFTVDAKGRLTGAGQRSLVIPDAGPSTLGLIQIAGDLTGPPTAPVLPAIATPGAYGNITSIANQAALAAITVTADMIGRDIRRLDDTRIEYIANALGAGFDKWLVVPRLAIDDQVVLRPTFDAKGRFTGMQTAIVTQPVTVLANIDLGTSAFRSGNTWARAANVITVTCTIDHGLRVGDRIYIDMTGGTAIDGLYIVASVLSSLIFTVASVGVNGVGTCTLLFFTVLAGRNVAYVTGGGLNDDYWVVYREPLPGPINIVNATTDVPGASATYAALKVVGGAQEQDERGVRIVTTAAATFLNVAVFAV